MSLSFYDLSQKLPQKPVKYVTYTGVVLFDLDRRRLLGRFGGYWPQDWMPIAHHMTINMGSAEEGPGASFLGKTVELQVRGIGSTDSTVAVKVETEVPSENPTKHITLAVRHGSSPKDSKSIEKWKPVEPMKVRGIVQEIEKLGTPRKTRQFRPPAQPAPDDPQEFLRMMSGKPPHIVQSALRGKFPDMPGQEIERLISQI